MSHMTTPAQGAFLYHANYFRALSCEADLALPINQTTALFRLAAPLIPLSISDTPPVTAEIEQKLNCRWF